MTPGESSEEAHRPFDLIAAVLAHRENGDNAPLIAAAWPAHPMTTSQIMELFAQVLGTAVDLLESWANETDQTALELLRGVAVRRGI